jgi:hypothetical protein
MSTAVIYSSQNVTITEESAEVRGKAFKVDDIEEIEAYDERPKALRWAKIGLALSGLSILFGLLATKGQSAGPGGLLFVVGAFMLFLGGGTLLAHRLNPAMGVGLIIRMTDGYAEVVKGLSRKEIEDVRAELSKRIRNFRLRLHA